jgi:hypothetical protein
MSFAAIPNREAHMANTPKGIDTGRLVADPRAIDELNQSVIKEFRANQGKVGGPIEGMPILTMTGAKTGRTLVRAVLRPRRRTHRDNRFLWRRAAQPALVS